MAPLSATLARTASAAGEPEVRELVRLVASGTQEQKVEAANMLGAFAAIEPGILKANQSRRASERKELPSQLIVRCGAVQPLCGLLAGGRDDGQIAAAATLASISGSHAAHQEAIAKAGAIAPLVAVLRSGSNRAQMQSAAALASLSSRSSLQFPILRAGAAVPLVRLARVGNADAQFFAASAIANLCQDNAEAQSAVAAAGVVPILVTMLQSGKVQMPAASALAKLAAGQSASTREAIARDGLAPLVALLHGISVPAQVQAAAALAELARDEPTVQISVAKAGGLRPLIAMMEGRNAQAQARAASAIAQVAVQNPDNQETIYRLGGLPPMISLLGREQSAEVQTMGALAVASTCHGHEENRTPQPTPTRESQPPSIHYLHPMRPGLSLHHPYDRRSCARMLAQKRKLLTWASSQCSRLSYAGAATVRNRRRTPSRVAPQRRYGPLPMLTPRTSR